MLRVFITTLLLLLPLFTEQRELAKKSKSLKDDALSENALESSIGNSTDAILIDEFDNVTQTNKSNGTGVFSTELIVTDVPSYQTEFSNSTELGTTPVDFFASNFTGNSSQQNETNSSLLNNTNSSNVDAFETTTNSSTVSTVTTFNDIDPNIFQTNTTIANSSLFIDEMGFSEESSIANLTVPMNETSMHAVNFMSNQTFDGIGNESLADNQTSHVDLNSTANIVSSIGPEALNNSIAELPITSLSNSSVALENSTTAVDNSTTAAINSTMIDTKYSHNMSSADNATKNETTVSESLSKFGNISNELLIESHNDSTKPSRVTDRTKVSLILGSTTTPTVDLNNVNKCEPKVPFEDKQNLSCRWEAFKGNQLKVWPSHTSASLCTALVKTGDHCKQLCEQHAECMSIHYCAECIEYNCRLLTDKKNSTSELSLTNAFYYVDYHEKMEC